jgi:hypothetical protein
MTTTATEQPANAYGLLAEFEDVDSLMLACEQVRDAGFSPSNWEAYTPCPVHGLDQAMGHKPTRLPWLILAGGMTGCVTGLFLTAWANTWSPDWAPYALRGYQFAVSGKPYYSMPAFIPPIFELTILFSSFAAFFGMLAFNFLPRFHHPVFNSAKFARATQDRFFIGIEAADPNYDYHQLEQLLTEAGATGVEELED